MGHWCFCMFRCLHPRRNGFLGHLPVASRPTSCAHSTLLAQLHNGRTNAHCGQNEKLCAALCAILFPPEPITMLSMAIAAMAPAQQQSNRKRIVDNTPDVVQSPTQVTDIQHVNTTLYTTSWGIRHAGGRAPPWTKGVVNPTAQGARP